MHTRPDQYDSHGISMVHESMIALNQIIVNSMIKAGMNPYALMPSIFILGHKPIVRKVKELQSIAERWHNSNNIWGYCSYRKCKVFYSFWRCINVNAFQNFKTVESHFYC